MLHALMLATTFVGATVSEPTVITETVTAPVAESAPEAAAAEAPASIADAIEATASEAAATEPAPPPEPAPAPAFEVPADTWDATSPVVVRTTVTTTTTTTTTTTPTVAPPPPPPPAPVLSPPAPTWGPVRMAPPPPPDAARTLQTMRTFRRGAVGVFTVGSLGLAGAMGLQWVRAQSLRRCIATGDPTSGRCDDAEVAEIALSRYSLMGMSMFVAGTIGSGVMFGNAAATRDVQLYGKPPRRRGGSKLLGAVAIGATSVWMIGANLGLLRREAACGDDLGCMGKYRSLRWAANDVAALGIAAGAGLVAHAVAYERQGKALARLQVAPALGLRHAGASLSLTF